MNRLVRQWAMSTVSICAIQIANAQVDILNIVPVQIPEQGTEIRVTFNRLPPEPQAYQLEKPSRLILDFEQVKPNLTQNSVAVLSSEVNSVDVAADDLRSRLTVNLAQAGQFTTRVEGNTFILKVNNTKNDTLPTQQKTIVNAHKGISNIDFQRGINGEGQVLIQLFDAHTPVDVQQQGTKVIVRFLGNKIPKNLAQRLNVNDFATPVTAVDAYNEGANGVIAIQTTGAYEYMAYQAEKQLTISLKNFSTQKAASLAVPQPKYSGQKVSLDFQDIEVRRVLQLLADFANTNLVAADSVTGNISLRMKDVPWDQALDIILKAKNLDKRQNGNVVWIAPVIELAKADEDQAKMLEQQIKIAPIQTEYIQLSYAKVEDIEKLITSNKTASNNNLSSSSDNKNNESLLSGRGSVSIDKRTNTLIVNDTEPFIVKIRRMVDLLDVPVKQVMVEARVVTADTNFTRELGVKWGLQRNNPSFPNTPGSNVWGGNLSPSFDLGVNLAAENAAGTFSFGLLKISDYMLNLQLSAMQADGYGEVLSAPKVLTGDKQRAYILRGDQIPYRTWSAETGVKTEFMHWRTLFP